MVMATAAIGTGLSIYQTIQAAKEKDAAKRALDNYERQQLDNVYKDVTVSTLGADRQREEQSRLAASQVQALQGAGTRGLVGGLGRVEVGNQNVNQQIAADLDQQQKQIDFATAGDQARIRGMQEERENADIAALSSQYMAGKQDENTGMGNTLMGVGMLGNSIGGMSGAGASEAGGVSTSGVASVPNTPMSDASMRFAPESGYANAPILTNPAYNPQNFGPQNAYGVFNQGYPYGNVYGPQNAYGVFNQGYPYGNVYGPQNAYGVFNQRYPYGNVYGPQKP